MRLCDVVITCLPSPAASDAVMQEMLPEVRPGKIWMEMSTTDAAEVQRLGALVIAVTRLAFDRLVIPRADLNRLIVEDRNVAAGLVEMASATAIAAVFAILL